MECLFFLAGMLAIFGGYLLIKALNASTSTRVTGFVLLLVGIAALFYINSTARNFSPWPTGFFLIVLALFVLFAL